ncbi:class I SAM-dependent methyltransferase [Trinickia sp. Y13]|uniref:class I SAM-dependent methyltransferase n=1 Tax=Trinickia sp. Y13 TaxID=2917807 RepID=UPI002405199C|nr:class I SAM-dependent methyltransferase [Trinickia sp. Y13]MDG0025746.1 class I SAM-dependent methyltransferase [Trinickia sp. Y13]
MSPEAYLEMADTELEHWWFRGRRDILCSILRQLKLTPQTRVLEVGSGTGGNLELLAEFGSVSGLEMDADALAMSVERTSGRFDIRRGRCPDDIPFHDGTFDLICFLDCLEHISDDVGTLRRMHALLAPGGSIVLTVPAYQWLWSAHDEFLHHRRRYDRASLTRCAHAAGYRIERITYFNTLLFPLAVAARLCDRLLRRGRSSGDAVPAEPLNAVLYGIFKSESSWLARYGLPFGVSLLAVLKADS